jgi:hypothetical protein
MLAQKIALETFELEIGRVARAKRSMQLGCAPVHARDRRLTPRPKTTSRILWASRTIICVNGN